MEFFTLLILFAAAVIVFIWLFLLFTMKMFAGVDKDYDMKQFHPLNPQEFRRQAYLKTYSRCAWQPGRIIQYDHETSFNVYGEDWPGRSGPISDKAIRDMLNYPTPI
jgi:hypothetical protein